jgi:hypothetical protein
VTETSWLELSNMPELEYEIPVVEATEVLQLERPRLCKEAPTVEIAAMLWQL